MHPLTESQRGEIIGLYKNKQSVPKISKMLKVYRTTVTRTINKYLNGDDLATRPRSGRPKLLTNGSQKILKTTVKNNNKKSAEEIKNKFVEKTNIVVSTKTIRRNLHEMQIFSRIPARKLLLNDRQRKQRLKWSTERRDWSVRKWRSVIWSDESRFTIFKNDGKKQITSNNKCCRIRDSITGRMRQDFTKSSNGLDRKYATENRGCYYKQWVANKILIYT